MPFTDLDLRTVKEGRWRLLAPLTYTYPDSDDSITVHEGFITDLASIPRLARVLVVGNDETRKPAVIHDYLYRSGIGTRKNADLVFRAGLREEGAPWKIIWACYLAVRIGGWASWNGD